jgi:hypothetical protein
MCGRGIYDGEGVGEEEEGEGGKNKEWWMDEGTKSCTW